MPERMAHDFVYFSSNLVPKRLRTDRSDFSAQTDAWWGFLVKENAVPVILTEFGMSQDPP